MQAVAALRNPIVDVHGGRLGAVLGETGGAEGELLDRPADVGALVAGEHDLLERGRPGTFGRGREHHQRRLARLSRRHRVLEHAQVAVVDLGEGADERADAERVGDDERADAGDRADSSNSHSGKTYGTFYKAGFIPTIKEKSTLTTIRGANRTWTTSAEFRVNAYDNLLLRVHQYSKYRHPAGAVIDLITETFNSSAGNHFLHPVTGQAKFNTIFDAYGWFRTEISDHLPVVCQLDVEGRP